MDSIKRWWAEERAKRAVERLEAHDFKAAYVRDRQEAVSEILKQVAAGQTIGVGGSLTIRELGILETLKARGHRLYDHWASGLSKEEVLSTRKAQMGSDLFLSSVNAITLNGELVNIDGIGNRVNSTIFGPGKVLLVAGYNKIVEDVQEAIRRIKNVSAPLNARRLNLDLPCARAARCVDCNSPQRICRVIVIHERRPSLTEMSILIVGEELGF
ncbi:MAG: lactate utilization protein [Desulfobacterota bacterium]|nr:lactate utilization protein [Thermodesulfobacteriota bacterium]